jgi:hypothetical protein
VPSRIEEHKEWTEHPVSLDGRMQPHEWIRTSAGYLKTDAFDHHDDHFFCGCQDIAWDVAGALLELELNAGSRCWFLERYRSLTGDTSIAARLPHYSRAYLAFRLGYCRLAGSVLGETPDGRRFVRAADRYSKIFRLELTLPAGARRDG